MPELTNLSRPLVITDPAKFRSACREIAVILLLFPAVVPVAERVADPCLISNTETETRNNLPRENGL
jgi:hypothetical protein